MTHKNAPDGRVAPFSNLLPDEFDVREDEVNQEPAHNVDNSAGTMAEPTGDDQNTNQDLTNLDSTVTMPVHLVTWFNKNRPQDQIIGNPRRGVNR